MRKTITGKYRQGDFLGQNSTWKNDRQIMPISANMDKIGFQNIMDKNGDEKNE